MGDSGQKKIAACSKDATHYKKAMSVNCGHIVCPACWTAPIGKQARTVSAKIRGFAKDAKLKNLKTDNELIVNHFIMSPPKGAILPDMPYNKIKQKGRDMARKAGITGGFMAFHPFRIKKRIAYRLGLLCEENAKNNPEEREKKFWELIRVDALKLGSWAEYVFWSPHYHVIGFGRLPDQKTDEEKETVKILYKGWVVVWIRHVDSFYQFDGTTILDPIKELAFYILSHAGYQPGKKIPVWLGDCSQNKIYSVVTVKQEYQVVCPKCAAPVVNGCETETGMFVPDLCNGKHVQYVLMRKEVVYCIGKSPKKAWRNEWQKQCDKARLDRLAMGIT
jgi:hypothetical protein